MSHFTVNYHDNASEDLPLMVDCDVFRDVSDYDAVNPLWCLRIGGFEGVSIFISGISISIRRARAVQLRDALSEAIDASYAEGKSVSGDSFADPKVDRHFGAPKPRGE